MRPRITGKSLGQNIGNKVTLFGTVTKVSSDHTSVELLTTDHVKVNVSLPEPFVEQSGSGLEVHGVVKSKSTVAGECCVTFPPDALEDFDGEQYNDFVTLLTFKLGQDKSLKKAFGMVSV